MHALLCDAQAKTARGNINAETSIRPVANSIACVSTVRGCRRRLPRCLHCGHITPCQTGQSLIFPPGGNVDFGGIAAIGERHNRKHVPTPNGQFRRSWTCAIRQCIQAIATSDRLRSAQRARTDSGFCCKFWLSFSLRAASRERGHAFYSLFRGVTPPMVDKAVERNSVTVQTAT